MRIPTTTGLRKLKDLADQAGRWLGLGTPPVRHTRAIEADRFDQMQWAETLQQATALSDLTDALRERHDHVSDLVADVWTASYKNAPHLRADTEMDASRTVNHQVVSTLLQAPEFDELHRETTGDAYAAAMAVISLRERLTRLLETSEDAQDAADNDAQARQAAADAAQHVADALDRARQRADSDGTVTDDDAQAVQAAIAAAEAAENAAAQATDQAQAALSRAAPGMRTALRAAAADAADQARQEKAMMAAWGVGPGELQRMGFAARAALAQRLASGRIGEFADLIGRFRAMATGLRAHRIENAPGELVGLVLGDDLGRIISSELVNLAVPALRGVFAARLAEKRLMLYDSHGEQPAGKGAIIACIDCSLSMATPQQGGPTGEAWAKACALALLDQARSAGRDFVGILFSSASELATFSFPADQPAAISDVADFAEHWFGGGTDFATPLDAAADVLETAYNADGTQRGDIVLITDGECEVTADWRQDWEQRKARLGCRVFGVAVAQSPGPVLQTLSDHLQHITDLTEPAAAGEMFQLI